MSTSCGRVFGWDGVASSVAPLPQTSDFPGAAMPLSFDSPPEIYYLIAACATSLVEGSPLRKPGEDSRVEVQPLRRKIVLCLAGRFTIEEATAFLKHLMCHPDSLTDVKRRDLSNFFLIVISKFEPWPSRFTMAARVL